MGIARPRRPVDQDPFTDLLFNSLLAFTFLFFLTIIFLNPPAKQGIIDPKAEFIVTTTWEDFSPDDIDTWVEDPDGNVLWFRNSEVGLMHLDRDDRGTDNDTILVNGERIVNPLNQEVVTVRGNVPGEYIVNLHYYRSNSLKPVPVDVRVVKVNPKLEVVYYGTVVLPHQGAERTAVRFSISRDGSVEAVNTLDKAIVKADRL
jgi:hypothetical protein